MIRITWTHFGESIERFYEFSRYRPLFCTACLKKKIRPEIKIYITREERERERENSTKCLPVPLILYKNSSYTAQNDPSEMSNKKDYYSILFQSFFFLIIGIYLENKFKKNNTTGYQKRFIYFIYQSSDVFYSAYYFKHMTNILRG